MAKPANTDVRLFTREEAEKTLPLVRVIVRDIVRDYEEYTRKSQELNARTVRQSAAITKEEMKALHELEEVVGALKKRIAEAGMELDKLGIELKDCQLGLIDFPTKIGNEVAYLCWKHGEEHIGFWHGLSEGYPGRRPLT